MPDPDDLSDWDIEADDGDAPTGAPRGDRQLPAARRGAPVIRADKAGPNPLGKVWNPRPVPPPDVDPDLPRLPWPERCAESVRYAVLAAEHWISRRGVLREWLRVLVWIGVGLLAAALIVVPPVGMLLAGVTDWSAMLKATAGNVRDTVASLPPLVIAGGLALLGYRLVQSRLARRRRYRQNDGY